MCPAELQHGSEHGRTVSRGSPQLYDSPYEEHGHYRTVFPEDERESRLPQDDERPADEYDQPWEWKKENISKALAGEAVTAVVTQNPRGFEALPHQTALHFGQTSLFPERVRFSFSLHILLLMKVLLRLSVINATIL